MSDDYIQSGLDATKPAPGLPQNIEAEQDLLGALLSDNNIFDNIADNLDEAHFFNPLNGRIFAATRKLYSNGQLANPVTLKSYFIGDANFVEIDIESYLRELIENVTSLSDAKFYAEDIYQCFLRRRLILISDDTISRSRTASMEQNAESLIEETEQQLFELAENDKVTSGLVPLTQALRSAIDRAEAAYKNSGHISGVGTGLTGLNNMLGGLQPSDLIILAGRPGMGKTALATNIAFHAATTNRTDENPQHVAFFSLEMSADQLANRILSSETGIPSDELRLGKVNADQFTNVVKTSDAIENAPFFIDDTPGLSVSQLASRARRLKRTHGLGLIVVDYLQLLSAPMGTRSENRVQEISTISRTLKNIAKELQIPVLALSQLSRAVEQREDKRPNLSDLRESGSIEQDADVVMFVYREEYYLSKSEPEQKADESSEHYQTRHSRWLEKSEKAQGKAEVIIAKQRHGSTGVINPNFIGKFTKFVDAIADDHLPERF
jgi:replicative DNA helicase